jgi:hypothetical protein
MSNGWASPLRSFLKDTQRIDDIASVGRVAGCLELVLRGFRCRGQFPLIVVAAASTLVKPSRCPIGADGIASDQPNGRALGF